MHIDRVYAQGRRERLEALTELLPETVTHSNFSSLADRLQSVDVLFSTWGMNADLAEKICRLPNLKAFFYAAGTVQHFARPLLDRGVTVVSAWAANAVPVAQFTLAQILLSLKGYFRNVRETRLPANHGRAVEVHAPGIFDTTVALLGCGMVGRKVAEMLRPFGLMVIVYDPFLTEEEAASLGVNKVSLEKAFSSAQVVSNHLPDLAPTQGLLNGRLFATLPQGTTFINTGRGATVVEAELAEILAQRPDLIALLDVTDPEPPAAASPWYKLDNVHLSSHIAGSQGQEILRMADYCLEEFERWRKGQPLRFRVTLPMLEKMA